MNDYSEIRFGLDCLGRAFNTEPGLKIEAKLREMDPEAHKKTIGALVASQEALANNMYLFSLSEFDPRNDSMGRLSMWRAYGGRFPVCIVVNPEIVALSGRDFGVFAVPVVYTTFDLFTSEFHEFAEKQLEKMSSDTNFTELCHKFADFALVACVATKHVGFSEEKELRLFRQPALWPRTKTTTDVIDMKGYPEKIIRFSFDRATSDGYHQLSLNNLIDHVIIGPTEHPLQLRDALALKMEEAGVTEPARKIFMSEIPFRG